MGEGARGEGQVGGGCALSDEERGGRHFPGYRVREEQLALAREFYHVFHDGGIAKLEGGTGVGKSLAYLAAAIPFAVEQAREGAKEPVVLSTRTKLLQDQLRRQVMDHERAMLGAMLVASCEFAPRIARELTSHVELHMTLCTAPASASALAGIGTATSVPEERPRLREACT